MLVSTVKTKGFMAALRIYYSKLMRSDFNSLKTTYEMLFCVQKILIIIRIIWFASNCSKLYNAMYLNKK
jgi:hypothetical protein